MRRDGKKNPASIRCLTMLLRCQHDSSTDPLRLMTAALRFTTVELRMLTMPPRFDTVLVRFKPVASRPPTNLLDLVVVLRQSQGGGGEYSHFFFIRRLGAQHLPFTPLQKKQQQEKTTKKKTKKKAGISRTPKIIWNFSNPQNTPILYLDLKIDPKCIEMTPKYSLILWWPPKNIHKIYIPKKYPFVWTSKFWTPKKITRMFVNIIVPPPPPPPPPPRRQFTKIWHQISLSLQYLTKSVMPLKRKAAVKSQQSPDPRARLSPVPKSSGITCPVVSDYVQFKLQISNLKSLDIIHDALH